MRTIKESILGTTDSGKDSIIKNLVAKLNGKMWSGKPGMDVMGQKLEVGDIVLEKESFRFWYVHLIHGRDVIINNSEDKSKVTVCDYLIKISDPQKLLKL